MFDMIPRISIRCVSSHCIKKTVLYNGHARGAISTDFKTIFRTLASDYSQFSLSGSYAVFFDGQLPTFRRNLLSPYLDHFEDRPSCTASYPRELRQRLGEDFSNDFAPGIEFRDVLSV
jgi:5'-3' exonuclease